MVVAANFTQQIRQNPWATSTVWARQQMKIAFWRVTWELLERVKCVSPMHSVWQAEALCLDDRYEKLISQFSEGVLKPKIETRCATKKSSVYYKVLWNSPREASKQKQPCLLVTCKTKQGTAWLASDGAGFGLCSEKGRLEKIWNNPGIFGDPETPFFSTERLPDFSSPLDLLSANVQQLWHAGALFCLSYPATA